MELSGLSACSSSCHCLSSLNNREPLAYVWNQAAAVRGAGARSFSRVDFGKTNPTGCVGGGSDGQRTAGLRAVVDPGRGSACKEFVRQLGQSQTRKALYDDFVGVAIEKVQENVEITPCPIQEQFRNMMAVDGTTLVRNFAYESEKIRVFRIAAIDGGQAMQVLNLAIFPRPEYDLPIFCADFFSTPARNIIVFDLAYLMLKSGSCWKDALCRDLNPLYNTEELPSYKEKYFPGLIPLANKYLELLPWGEKLTYESIQFFSPIVLWTKPESQDVVRGPVFDAFQDYLQAYLALIKAATPSTDGSEISRNMEAQHRYLMWRATKDPGRPVLTRLYGQHLCETYVKDFLFSGLNTLGSKTFVDYFPEYRDESGCVSKQRSMMGRSFLTRPWDENGNLIQPRELEM